MKRGFLKGDFEKIIKKLTPYDVIDKMLIGLVKCPNTYFTDWKTEINEYNVLMRDIITLTIETFVESEFYKHEAIKKEFRADALNCDLEYLHRVEESINWLSKGDIEGYNLNAQYCGLPMIENINNIKLPKITKFWMSTDFYDRFFELRQKYNTN